MSCPVSCILWFCQIFLTLNSIRNCWRNQKKAHKCEGGNKPLSHVIALKCCTHTSTLLSVFPIENCYLKMSSFIRLSKHTCIPSFIIPSSLQADSLYSLYIESYISCFNGDLRCMSPDSSSVFCTVPELYIMHTSLQRAVGYDTHPERKRSETATHLSHTIQLIRLRHNWDLAEIRLRFSGLK